MKVEKTPKTSSRKKVQKTETPTKSSVSKISFTEILAIKDYQEQRSALQAALDEIDKKGTELVEKRTVENLYIYKKMIQDFVSETVNGGFEIKERRGYPRSGRAKVMRTVSEIDQKLVELTNLILKREHKEVNILKKVGEIQGLLVNLTI